MIRILHMIGALEMGGSQALVMNLYRHMDREQIQFDFVLDHPDRDDYADEVRALGGRIYTMPGFHGNVGEVRRAWDAFFAEHPEYHVLHSHVRSYASLYLPVAYERYFPICVLASVEAALTALFLGCLLFCLLRMAKDYLARGDALSGMSTARVLHVQRQKAGVIFGFVVLSAGAKIAEIFLQIIIAILPGSRKKGQNKTTGFSPAKHKTLKRKPAQCPEMTYGKRQ